MAGSIVRGLIAGVTLLALAGITAAIGVVQVSDAAAAGTIVTLLLLMALVLFDSEWDSADAPVPEVSLGAEADSTAA